MAGSICRFTGAWNFSRVVHYRPLGRALGRLRRMPTPKPKEKPAFAIDYAGAFHQLAAQGSPAERNALISAFSTEASAALARQLVELAGYTHALEKSAKEYRALVEQALQVLKLAGLAEERGQLVRKLRDAEAAAKRQASARHAIEARHNQDEGYRAKRAACIKAWESGRHPTRKACAEAMAQELNISYSAARRALNNTPEPERGA